MLDLQKKGLKKLILDLRDNGGGILEEAIDIADDFLDGDKLIVYTQGVNSPKREYSSRTEGLFEKGKLVVLTDEGTASASEVLTGALQDWDRATIIGRRTFGKGLVQEQYALSDGSAVRLTVARYYTPAGRSIQKPYDKENHEAYNEEVMKRFHDGEVLHQDTTLNHNGKVYKTFGGRTVYGGGGITPDIFVAFDTSTLDHQITSLYIKNTLNRFIYTYYIRNIAEFNEFKTASDFAKNFHHDDEVWKSLSNFAALDSINLKLVPEKDRQLLITRLKALLGREGWRQEGYFEVVNTYDPVVQRAMQEINKN
jgi:carboxyl-terminal processing protease